MTEEVTDKRLIDFTRFVATKFSDRADGWKYTRNRENFEYARFKTDYTGYNVWYKRFVRGLTFAWSHNVHARKGSLAYQLGGVDHKATIWRRVRGIWIYFWIQMRKDRHVPDGFVGGNPTWWEEDGEYIAMMGPTVGVKVLDFLEAEPDHPHAKEILAEMHRMHRLSWGKDTEDE